MPASSRAGVKRCIELPQSPTYILHDANVPSACLDEKAMQDLRTDIDSLVNVVGYHQLRCLSQVLLGKPACFDLV